MLRKGKQKRSQLLSTGALLDPQAVCPAGVEEPWEAALPSIIFYVTAHSIPELLKLHGPDPGDT